MSTSTKHMPVTINSLKRVSKDEIAALFQVTDKTIQRWRQDGLPGHGEGRGQYYVWAECLPWFLGRESRSRGGDDETDKDRKLRAEADLAEMDRDTQAGELMKTGDALRAWGGFLRGLESNLMGYPDRVALDLEDGMTLAERRETLRKAMIQALTGLIQEAQLAGDREAPAA